VRQSTLLLQSVTHWQTTIKAVPHGVASGLTVSQQLHVGSFNKHSYNWSREMPHRNMFSRNHDTTKYWEHFINIHTQIIINIRAHIINIHYHVKVKPATQAHETCTRNLCRKLAQEIWRKFIAVSCTKTTLWPITLHGSCHVLDSFCAGIELCSIACKKLVPELKYNKLTRLTDTRGGFLYQTSCTSFSYEYLGRVSPALSTNWWVSKCHVQIQKRTVDLKPNSMC